MRTAEADEYAEFVRAQSASLFRTAYLMTGDYQRAEDVLQSALVKVYLRWRQIRSMSQPGAYARRVVVNQSISWWRSRASRERPVDEFGDFEDAGHADAVADRDETWQAVLRLPPRRRAVIVLRYYEDLSEADIAEVLGMAVGTVKSHCHAACHQLATMLDDPADARRRT